MIGRTASALRGRPLAAAAFATVGFAATGGGFMNAPQLTMALSPYAEAKAAPATPSPFVRIVSYNVLSSHLCEPEHFLKCDPADLDPPTRRKRVEEVRTRRHDSLCRP